MTRFEQIAELYNTRNDHLPDIVKRASHAAAGFAHGVPGRMTCPDCLANDRPRMKGCETCDGHGWIEEERAHDPYALDKQVQPYGLDGSYLERWKARDRVIDQVGRQLEPPRATELDVIADANQHPYSWEIGRRRMFRDYDYAALERALDMLRQVAPDWKPLSEPWLVFVDKWMPSTIRAPKPQSVADTPRPKGASLNPFQLRRRDEEIRSAHAAGRSCAELAAEHNLSDRMVRKIVAARVAA